MGDVADPEAETPWLYNGRVGRASLHGIHFRRPSLNLRERFSKSKRSGLEKCLIACAAILFLSTVAFIVAFVVYYEKSEELSNICTTEECVVAAAQVRAGMDMSVEPCEDFYEFACGTWRKETVLPEDRGGMDMFGILRDRVGVILRNLLEEEQEEDIESIKKAKDLYASCINESRIEERGIKPALEFMATIGGWPMIDKSWTEANFDLTSLLITLRKYNNAPIVNMYVGADTKNSARRVIYIDQSAYGMPGQKYYQRGRDDVMVMAYEQLISNIASELSNNSSEITKEVKDIVDFEFNLANISVPSEDRRDNEALYNRYNISQLEANYTKIEWLRYFQELMNITGVDLYVNESEPVINKSPLYFTRLMGLIEETDERTLANYLVWRIMQNRAHGLTEKFRNFYLEYDKVLYGTTSSRPRFMTCTSYVVNNIGLAVGRLFVDSTFQEDSKTTANEMIANLRESFKELLDELDWMDESTKAVARDKADAINPKIGYPDDILNDTALNELFENNTYRRDFYFENVLENIQRSVVNNFKFLRSKVDRNIWTTAPSTVNAFYNSMSNQIMFPAGILQPPFYSHNYPKSLNYGAIGVVIGHEITHGFDDRGRQYDKMGNLVQWWGEKALQDFKNKAKCIIDQYSKYLVPEADMYINGINTQGENIADNGGVKQSYRAYRKWVKAQGREEKRLPGLDYTHNQLFFISFAQIWCANMRREHAVNRILAGVHSPNRYRVIGTMQNSPEFSEAFKCPRTSYMNPAKKCKVW